MRKCIVVVHPKANCAPQFQMLNKNNKGLAFASWAGFGKINNVLQEYKNLQEKTIILGMQTKVNIN